MSWERNLKEVILRQDCKISHSIISECPLNYPADPPRILADASLRMTAILLGFLALLTFLTPYANAAREKTSEQLFLASGGAEALKEKKYEQALAKIDKLFEIQKNDPYLYKTKGIILLKTGKKSESRKWLKKALKLNPLDRQSRYYLALIDYQEQKKEAAKEQLQMIVENPDELGYYEEKAQRALGVIETKPIRGEERKDRLWKVHGSYGYEYDDNVSLQSSVKTFKVGGDRNANRFTVRSGGTYDFFRSASMRTGIGYSFSQSFHSDNLEEFNYRSHVFQTYYSYFTEFFGHQTAMGTQYSFSHGTLDTHTFSSANTLLNWISVEVLENMMLSLYNNLSQINFRDKGFDEGISSRDGWYNTSGIMDTLYFSGKKRSISTAYEFGYNQTEGDNFDARVHAVRVILKSHLIEKIRGEASFSVLNDNHYNFAPIINRHDMHYDLEVKLIRPITRYIEFRIHYTFSKVHDFHAGALGQFQYDRHIVGGEVYFTY